MSKKTKVISIIVFLGILGGTIFYFQFNEDKSGNTLSNELFGWKYPVTKFPLVGPNPSELAYSSIRDPGGMPEGLPVRLKIPAIGVNSAIEDALITQDGRMDVPSGSVNVAWFALGPQPGRTGSAVIGGHFGIRKGVKFVFYDLDKLVVGDKVYIENDKGETLTFQVRSIKLFDRNADATTVFTSEDGLAHLNLITCEGIWNKVNNTYPERRVVFTNLISDEEASLPIVPISTKNNNTIEAITSFPQAFGIGTRGLHVVALQTFLEEKGFLSIPLGVTKGFFGSLTRIAVAKYQTSLGLSPVGIFGPQTRARILLELRDDTGLPNAGIDEIISPDISRSSWISVQIFFAPLKSLFKTPIDGLITSLLLILIVFLSLKISNRKSLSL